MAMIPPDRTTIRLKTPQVKELADLELLLSSGLVGGWRTAIDGGAHVGGWTRALAARFAHVHAYEPALDTFSALRANTADLGNVTLHQQALLDRATTVAVHCPPERRALTARYVIADPLGMVEATTVDALGLEDLDLLKLDVEGAEVLALRGARQTLRRCRPLVIIEEFGHGHRYGHPEGAAAALLKSFGYAKVWAAGPNLAFMRSPK